MEIPKEIEKEIVDSLEKYGACGYPEYVEEKEDSLIEQECDLSFCDKEYYKEGDGGVGTLNVREGVAYYPYKEGFIMVGYSM